MPTRIPDGRLTYRTKKIAWGQTEFRVTGSPGAISPSCPPGKRPHSFAPSGYISRVISSGARRKTKSMYFREEGSCPWQWVLETGLRNPLPWLALQKLYIWVNYFIGVVRYLSIFVISIGFLTRTALSFSISHLQDSHFLERFSKTLVFHQK